MKRILIIMLISVLLGLSACANPTDTVNHTEFGAIVVNNVSEYVKESFALENRTYGAYYDGSKLTDLSCPKERVFIISTQNDFDAVFDDEFVQQTADFDSEIYVLYTFTTLYHNEFIIDSATVSDQTLNVQYHLQSEIVSGEEITNAACPFQRYVLIKVKRIDVNSVIFIDTDLGGKS